MGVLDMNADEKSQSTNPPDNRRTHDRYDTSISVDYNNGENFLFSYIQNISEMGIFIRSEEPLEIGTKLTLRFGTEGSHEKLQLDGEVVWVNPVQIGENPNPGMGVRFTTLTPDQREDVVALVRTIAYLQNSEN